MSATLDSVLVRLRETPSEVRRALAATVASETYALANYVKTRKLSGQVLNQRSQRLVRSIQGALADDGGSIIGTVGTNVEYAAHQEYGFTGTEQVREHARAITQAFGRALPAPVTVEIRAHSRQVDYPAHSYLRSSLAENEGRIRGAIQTAIEGAINQ